MEACPVHKCIRARYQRQDAGAGFWGTSRSADEDTELFDLPAQGMKIVRRSCKVTDRHILLSAKLEESF